MRVSLGVQRVSQRYQNRDRHFSTDEPPRQDKTARNEIKQFFNNRSQTKLCMLMPELLGVS